MSQEGVRKIPHVSKFSDLSNIVIKEPHLGYFVSIVVYPRTVSSGLSSLLEITKKAKTKSGLVKGNIFRTPCV